MASQKATLPRPLVDLTSRFHGAYPALMLYEPKDLEVKAGSRVKLAFRNDDVNPLGKHNWKLKGVEAETKVIAVGQTDTIEFDAPAKGTYVYVCSVPSHEGFGMKGSFVVKE